LSEIEETEKKKQRKEQAIFNALYPSASFNLTLFVVYLRLEVL